MVYPSKGIDQTARALAIEGLSTGLLTGGEITINANLTPVDIAAGTARVIDASNPGAITQKPVAWNAMNVPITNIATQLATFLSLDSDGNPVQNATAPENGRLREEVSLGSCVHTNGSTIELTSDFTPARPMQLAPTITDMSSALQVINRRGNVITGGSANDLKLQKTGGKQFFAGIQRDPDNPNNKNSGAQDGPNLILVWRDGAGGFNTTTSTTITAGVYDNNGGGVGAPSDTMTPNRWTNHIIFFSPDLDQIFVQYGQFQYLTSAAAIDALPEELRNIVSTPALSEVPIVAALTMETGATNLNDTGHGVFTDANRFGFF